jgi:hypothetical protein
VPPFAPPESEFSNMNITRIIVMGRGDGPSRTSSHLSSVLTVAGLAAVSGEKLTYLIAYLRAAFRRPPHQQPEQRR